jgi:hypothetical protein
MRPSHSAGLLLFVLVAVLGSSSPAQAWTRTLVKSARATVDVERDATLSILLRLDVEVHAGWLHEIELAGLGTGVELDRYRPPYFRSEEGEIFRPEAEVQDDGVIHLSFARREAPRRGEYRVFMRYRTKADVRAVEVEGEPRARIVWSVPSWETGLHNVSVEIRAPKGSLVPTEMHDVPAGVDFQVAERAKGTVVEWRRIHLPRMTAWPLTLDIPVDSIALPTTAPDAPAPSGFRPLELPQERPIAWALCLLAALVLLKRRSLEARMGRHGLLVPAPWSAVLAVTGTVLAIGQWLAPNYLVCTLPLIAFSLHRPARCTAPATRREWRTARYEELPETKTLASDFLDGTTMIGLTVLVAGGVCLVALGQPAAALLLLPLFLTGTRHHMAATAAQTADALRLFASELRPLADAPEMSLAWELSSDSTPRLRTHLPTHRAGLMTLSFVVASSPLGLVLRRKIMLLIETRAQSDADDLVRRRTNAEPDLRACDGSILRLIEWNAEAMELLRVLARKTPKPMKASRGTWLLREISEPRRKAA